MKNISIIFFMLLFMCFGCSSLKVVEEMSSDEIAEQGIHEFEKENYRASIKHFEKIKDWYPFSKHAITAELKIADAYYKLEQYQEAVAEYELFTKLHPLNEAISYVIYQIGSCYFEQIDTVDRDQTPAHKALTTFRQLKENFPGTDYAEKTEEKIQKCLKSISGHDFYVGVFYYKSKHYKGALSRFNSVINNYPDIEGSHDKALHYIELCKTAISKAK